MKSIYAIAFMTENLDGEKDLYVETIAASSREEAIGMCMESGEGSEILSRGEKLVKYNVAKHDPDDTAAMVSENQQEADNG